MSHNFPFSASLGGALLALALIPSTTEAQVPLDSVVVLDASASPNSNFTYVDALGRGAAKVRNQTVFANFLSVTADPTDATRVYYETNNVSSFSGTWEAAIRLGEFALNRWGLHGRSAATRIRCGLTDLFGLESDNLFVMARSGGNRRFLLPTPNAVDLAPAGAYVFVATRASGANALIRYTIQSQQSTTLASINGMRAIAWSASTAELLVITDQALLRVNPNTGAILSTSPVATSNATALVADSTGRALYCEGTNLWAERFPGAPIFVAAQTILDLTIGQQQAASVIRYGVGCVGSQMECVLQNLPNLGENAFFVGVRNARAGWPAGLLFGGSRSFSSVLQSPLPIDLTPIGMSQCALLTDPVVVLGVLIDAAGQGNVRLPIPNNPWLQGQELSCQWFMPWPGTNAFGAVVSEGVAFQPQ